ncbi:cytochrome P450 [Bradyrhizobium erythrophlei]|uniref:cytochrome P450 n=1 Tax=Bradyrhizobium erythrophlei TaxID=1437360 RepID=UPI0035ED8CFE
MTTAADAIVPPAPKVHARDLPALRLIVQFARNTVSTMPNYAFDVMISHRRVLGLDTWLVNDPDGVRHILGSNVSNYRKLVALYRVFQPLAGQGVFLAEGDEWRRQRRMLAPLFTPASIGLLLPHFFEAANALVRRVERSATANLSEAFQEATLEAVLRALFSLPDNEQRGRLAAMVRGYLDGPGRPNILDGFARTETSFAFATWKRRQSQAAWHAAVDALVAARRASPRTAEHGDLLDLLISARDPETGDALSDTEIRDQSATMLVAGHETTARLLFWATYLLTLGPAEQARLRTEIAEFPPERVGTLDDLQHWPRLRQTLYEALRLYPPAPHVNREAIADDTVLGERVEAGAQVWISPWVIHRHRKFWDQPTAFMPDRFAGKASPWTSGTFIPFGAGPRICIGATFAIAEAQIIMAILLSRFSIALDDPRPVLPVGTALLAPSHEPQFKIERV